MPVGLLWCGLCCFAAGCVVMVVVAFLWCLPCHFAAGFVVLYHFGVGCVVLVLGVP